MEKRVQSFDVCIVCALYEEARAVLDEISTRCHVSFLKEFSGMDRYEYRYTSILNNRGEPLTVLVTWLSDSGPTQTGLDLKPFLHEFRPRFVAMTGFCAGYKKKVKWGDLVVAQYAYFYEAGKVIHESEGLSRHLQEMKTGASTSQVLHYARGFDGWKELAKKMKSDRLKRELKDTEEPRCVIAPMASGMAVRQDDPFLWLREHYDRNTVGLDMEAATFYQALRAVSHIHGLVVKGVCDYANMNKKDTYHDYAARASAVYLLSFIQEYVTEQTMPQRDVPPPSSRAGPSGVWNIPHVRNPRFTGRDDLLDLLHRQLTPIGQNVSAKARTVALTQPLAIKGLGGIGKTQIAVEYAYRSRDQGHYTHTLWVNATSEEAIITSLVAIAELLPSFSAKSEGNQRELVEAVKRWLEQCEQRWLLVFDNIDNADDLPIIQEYLPQRGNGSVLLTTRAHTVGSVASASIEVEKMGLMEGSCFLLRRAFSLTGTSDEEVFERVSVEYVNEAGNIVIALDALPLALDQAGAYIEETQCSLSHYLTLYQTHSKKLLARRGIESSNYPLTVETTWSLSFQKVQQANPAAAELLRACAFLAPDAIPEELISNAGSHWSSSLRKAAADPFLFDQMIATLHKFSLLKRFEETKTLSIHRLVQAVLIDTMKQDVQRRWAKQVILTVNAIFPKDPQDLSAWPQCFRYLDQVQACRVLLETYRLAFAEAADILNRTGLYLSKQALYSIAEPLHQRALAIQEQLLGTKHPNVATSLHNLAHLYRSQGKYKEAELLYQRALAIDKKAYGAGHLSTAVTLNNLADLYRNQGEYVQAEPLHRQALAIQEKQLGTKHPDVATSLNNLASLYEKQGKYTEVEPLYQRALTIREQQLGIEHPDVATSLNNLAGLYEMQGKYTEAESLYRRALTIYSKVYGPEHPFTATSLHNLAFLYESQGKYTEAEPLYQQVLAIYRKTYGTEHPNMAISLSNLAGLYKRQGKYTEAEPLYQQALVIQEQLLGMEHPDVATSLNNLAGLYYAQGKYTEAEPLYRQSLAIQEKQPGMEHLDMAISLNNLAGLYYAQGKYTEAEPLYERVLAIRKRTLGIAHSDTACSLNNLAILYMSMGKDEQVMPLYQHVLGIPALMLDSEHSIVKTTQSNYTAQPEVMERNEEGE